MSKFCVPGSTGICMKTSSRNIMMITRILMVTQSVVKEGGMGKPISGS